jgi:hypothetical protein
MKRAGGLVILGLLLASAAAAAGTDPAGCSVRKGLYEEWVALSRRGGSPLRFLKLVGGNNPATPDSAKEQAIAEEYQAFFQCLSDAASQSGAVRKQEEDAIQPLCDEAANDRLASLVCQTVLYVRGRRSESKQFMDALPTGKKGAEMIWDLEAIAELGQKNPAAIFFPKGPAYKLIDELFVLVLDDKETAASKYFNLAASASEAGARHMDNQIKVLFLESPAVVVKQWATVRQSLPRVKKLLAELTASLPPRDLRKMRQGIAGFCAKDNLDCPEILKTFGRPD